MLEKFKLVCYLHWRYKIRPSLWSVSGKPSGGSYWVNYDSWKFEHGTFLDKINKCYVYVNWLTPMATTIFLHEVGHISQLHRAAKHKFRECHVTSHIFSEKRASLWAIRAGKVFGQIEQKDINYLDWCYGTYVGHHLKRSDPQQKAKISYKATRVFGVRY